MEIAIIASKRNFENKLIAKEAEKRGLNVKYINPKSVRVLVDGDVRIYDRFGREIFDENVIALSRVERRVLWEGFTLLLTLEKIGCKVINSAYSLLIGQNKFLTMIHLLREGIPVPMSYLSFSLSGALKFINQMGYPIVLKPIIGGKGKDVMRADCRKEFIEAARYHLDKMNCVLMQRFIRHGGRDIRILVVGGEVIAAMYRVAAPGQWKTNIALGGKPVPFKPDDELTEIAIRSAEAIKAEIAGVDIAEENGRMYVFEVNPTPLFRGLIEATKVNPAKYIIEYAMEMIHK